MEIYTEAEFAEMLKMPTRVVADIRKRENWPHLRFGRSIRYTAEHVDEIMRTHITTDSSRGSEAEEHGRLPGQTSRSAAYNYRRR